MLVMKVFGISALCFTFFVLVSSPALAQSMITTYAGPSLPVDGSPGDHSDHRRPTRGQRGRRRRLLCKFQSEQGLSRRFRRGSATTGGSVRVIPADGGAPPIPLVLFSYKPGGTITVSQAGVPSTTGTAFRVYVEFSGTDGQPGAIQSGIAMANNTFTPVTVTLELTNLDGSSTNLPGPVSQTLPGFGHIGQFLNQAFPGVPGPFKGILRISAPASGVSVIGLRSRYNERGDFLI